MANRPYQSRCDGHAEVYRLMYKQGAGCAGAFSMLEQDKLEQFVNGRVGMMINSLAT